MCFRLKSPNDFCVIYFYRRKLNFYITQSARDGESVFNFHLKSNKLLSDGRNHFGDKFVEIGSVRLRSTLIYKGSLLGCYSMIVLIVTTPSEVDFKSDLL